MQEGSVTSLVALGASGERVSVHIDGKAAFDLSVEVVEGCRLRQGMWLEEDAQASLLEQDEPFKARASGLAMLARRELCARQIIEKLLASGHDERVAVEAVEWLRERGFVDDARYARAFAAEKARAGWGRRKIVGELMRKGVDRELLVGEGWERVGAPHVERQTPEVLADTVGRRFRGQLQRDQAMGRRRIEGYLARRGHDWEMIGQVVRLVLAQECEDEEADISGDVG